MPDTLAWMGESHMDPVNAIGRFVLELVALYGIGRGVWEVSGNLIAVIVVAGLAAFVWGRFRVPDDPGPAPVAVPGVVRLAIEALILIGGGVGLTTAHERMAIVYLVALVVHYATTRRRLRHVLSFR
jgi:hypothetical protein